MVSYWSRFASTYALLGGEGFWLQHRQRLVAGLRGRVLEVCCGGGRLVVELLRQGCDAYGIDLAPRMVSLARAELERAGFDPARISEADVTHLPFSDDEFDAVVSTGSIGLFPLSVQRKALREVARVARQEVRLLEPIEKRSGLYVGRILAFAFDGMRPIPRALLRECGLHCEVEWDILCGAFSGVRCFKSQAGAVD